MPVSVCEGCVWLLQRWWVVADVADVLGFLWQVWPSFHLHQKIQNIVTDHTTLHIPVPAYQMFQSYEMAA